MKNIKKNILLLAILLLAFSFTSCGDDDSNQEEQDVFAGCCSDEPTFGDNVDNLDQSLGEIIVYNLFTPNGDGVNDLFFIENIDLYDSHTVTIYNENEEVLFQSTNYGSSLTDFFPTGNQGQFGAEDFSDGTYKYQIVIQNEQTYKKSGTFCLFGNFSALEEQNFIGCSIGSEFDPTITGPLD
jgi:gliding motility-associated-like protein